MKNHKNEKEPMLIPIPEPDYDNPPTEKSEPTEKPKLFDPIKQKIEKIRNLFHSMGGPLRHAYHRRENTSQTWDPIWSPRDTISDTVLAIEEYIDGEYPESYGLKYIYCYGILQILVVQQDAMSQLYEELCGEEWKLSEQLLKIRDIRNRAIGHPTRKREKDGTSYNYIGRGSMNKTGFRLLTYSEKTGNEFKDIDVTELICNQLSEIENAHKKVKEKLEYMEETHKKNFKDQKLEDILTNTVYDFEKVYEAIEHRFQNAESEAELINILGKERFHAETLIKKDLGVTALDLLEKKLCEFKIALEKRKELGEEIEENLDLSFHAVEKLRNCFSDDETELEKNDGILLYKNIDELYKNFLKTAGEIDRNYSND